MRRATSAALVALALMALTSCGSAKASPTVATDNFTPTVALVLHSCGVPPNVPEHSSDCPQSGMVITKPGNEVSGPAVQHVVQGSVLLIDNHDGHDRRVVGTIKHDQVFDTGIMRPNDRTTVVLTTPGEVSIVDTTTDQKTSLTVKPKPGTKG